MSTDKQRALEVEIEDVVLKLKRREIQGKREEREPKRREDRCERGRKGGEKSD
jgi:hypothetical protein